MSERGDHLIERAAARLRAAKDAGIPPAPAEPVIIPAVETAPTRPEPVPSTTNELSAAPGLPNGWAAKPVPGFKPFAAPPPNRGPVLDGAPPREIPTHTIPLAPTMLDGPPPASPGPVPTNLPPQPPPAQRAPIVFREDLPDAVQGPVPTPGLPLRTPKPAAAPPAVNINLGGASPFAAARPPMANGLGGLSAPPTALSGAAGQPGVARGGGQAAPIVQLDALERAGMVVARTTRTRISEEYRIAIGRILRTLHEAPDVQGARNVLMVTSARPGEGKSFTALNLAGSIAQNGTDAVLLIDVDPKVRPLSEQLGLGEAQGFLDLVSDPSLRPEDLLRVTAIPNLAVMPVGTRLGGAAQTIGGTASTRPIIPTITRLARRFPKHLIMLDAPPCLSTSDPHTLAPHVGQVVLVVEAERTQRSEVEAAIELVRVCPSITMLLNKVRMTTSHTFGAYDYFGSYT